MERRKFLLDQLCMYPTLAELHRSSFFREAAAEIESLLGTPDVIPRERTAPRLAAFVRVAQWNLEKGRQLDAAIRRFETDAHLRWADILFVNEADVGMNRSDNQHVARRLGEALEMNVAFAPTCLELTKGIDEELQLPGDNRESLQGNAVLSRYPIMEARVVRLPQCFEPYEFPEKRYGGRNCLWVRLRIGTGTLWAGSTHLEVRNTPGCRARQVERLMAELPGNQGEPCLLGGDLNTNCLARGTRRRSLWTAAQFLLTPPDRLKRRFLDPPRFEPLFLVAAQAKFSTRGLNSTEATASALVEGSEDAKMAPAFLRRFAARRLAHYRDGLPMKLDWFFGKDIHPLRAGECVDRAAGVASCDPGCIPTPRIGPSRISDHSPIFADLQLVQSIPSSHE